MKQTGWALGTFVLLVALVTLACGAADLPSVLPATATPQVAPTPLGDTVSYRIPAYSVQLQPGEPVPGTRLQYIGRSGNAFEVSINGQQAIKQAGDSLIWNGVVAPGMYGNFNLRLTTAVLGGVPVAGSVELIAFNPDPARQPLPDDAATRLRYGGIVIDERIPVGRQVPGTTATYSGIQMQGIGEQAARLAQFEGIDETFYPYLTVGDSLIWSGRVRDNVYARYNMRLVSFDENEAHLIGTAELWITR